MGSRRKARECALQMLFAADVSDAVPDEVLRTYWAELGDTDTEEPAREFATRLAAGTLAHLDALVAALPSDLDQLRGLQARCLHAARDALHAGQHLEARRLGDLAGQLGKRAQARSNR